MKALFIGLGSSAPAYYRCALPAKYLNQDWIGMIGNPEKFAIVAGNNDEPDFNSYDIIVIQQSHGKEWNKFIQERQANGQKVLFECDDFLHGVRKIKGHRFQKSFHKKKLKEFQESMSLCDGMICSTDFLSGQYSKYNPNQFVCKVGIETKGYDVGIPERDTINIGWAGGTGHHQAVAPWLSYIVEILNANNNVRFVSIGTDYASAVEEHAPQKTLSVPWTDIENIPYALSNIDIAIAPSHESKYFKSKSDLRWLEASAVGIPTVCSDITYPDAAIHIAEKTQIKSAIENLINDHEYRKELGRTEQSLVRKTRDISVAVESWRTTFETILK